MALDKIDIGADHLRWAYARAGLDEAAAIRKFPILVSLNKKNC